MSLTRYRSKRTFARTPEPSGKIGRGPQKALAFVIQKHAARNLHYDFRLEMDGVLKSWAVPKGLPTQRGEKRLAMHVEDHPLEYGDFEGIIPKGNYGAGTVMLWDHGTYQLEGDPDTALRQGKLVLSLEGKKLKGEWTLVRMRSDPNQENKPWLLIKTGETIRPVSARKDDASVKSGRTMKQIAENVSTPASASESPAAKRTRSQPKGASKKLGHLDLMRLPRAAPEFIPPMKALLRETLPQDGRWVMEVKLDGIRAIVTKKGTTVRIFSRRPKELTSEYPDIVAALKELPVKDLVLDGEIVALDDRGYSSFQLLQNRNRSRPPAIRLYLFDLLNFEGRDLTGQPLSVRKAALERLLESAQEPLRLSVSLQADPQEVWKQVQRFGLEGVVAKRPDSRYEPGLRTGAWIKVKAQNQQEFVIGGYTPPKGARTRFGAIVVGYYQGARLVFAAKVGTGFDSASLEKLFRSFQEYRTPDCPFANLPANRDGGAGQSISRKEMKEITWLQPKLVCEVKFQEWTREGNLRQPVFLGLRDDKPANEVVREPAKS